MVPERTLPDDDHKLDTQWPRYTLHSCEPYFQHRVSPVNIKVEPAIHDAQKRVVGQVSGPSPSVAQTG